MKTELAKVSSHLIDEYEPFVVETGANYIAFSGVLSQNGKPAAFYLCTFNDGEKRLHPVERKAFAIEDAVRKWKHLLTGS